jgi:hypothetical protein
MADYSGYSGRGHYIVQVNYRRTLKYTNANTILVSVFLE